MNKLVTQQPWYKQFWPWFIIALPTATVVAGFITLWISIKYADSLVVDDYYKEGLAINSNINKEKLATKLGLDFNFFIIENSKQVAIRLKNPNSIKLPQMLELKLIHPIDSQFDMEFPLRFDEKALYIQQYSELQDIDWTIEIKPLYLQNPNNQPDWKLRSKRSKLTTSGT